MSWKPRRSSRLAARYLDDDLLLSNSHAWTYVRLPLLPYEFLPYQVREGLCQQITLAMSGLITSNTDPVNVHLRVTSRPFDTLRWAGDLQQQAKPNPPAPGWGRYLAGMASTMHGRSFTSKEVYLGVCLGPLRGRGSVKPASKDTLGVLEPLRGLLSKVEASAGYEDLVVPASELDQWRDRAWDVRRSLANSYLRAIPASSAEVAWLIAQPFWRAMDQPPVSASKESVWGPGSLRHLVEGTVVNNRKWIQIDQIDDAGEERTVYSVTLAVSRFPDELSFPDQEPWIHFAASFGFPVEFSSRLSIVPAGKVAKDVSRKLADAKDQAQHIAESGIAVPLKVREQLDVATALEYRIDKEREPWSYGRHRITVTADSIDAVLAQAKTVVENYRELGMDLAWPTGDQFDLLLESLPGDKPRGNSYYQRQDLAVIAGGMPTASSECGDKNEGSGWFGPYLGFTTSRTVTPVLFSPHVAMARNFPPGVCITGSPGAGKSFLAFTLAYQMAVQGVWTIYIDPKADAKPMGLLPGLGKPRVFDLRDGNDGMLDPFSLGETKSEATLLALETLRLLLGGNVSEEREEALLNAVEVVANSPEPSLSMVVDVLTGNQASAGARNLGALLRTIRELPFARLCFSAIGGSTLRPEDGLTVVTLLGLDLPSASTAPEDYSYDNRLAVSVMYLLTRYARRLMLSMDKSHPKAICVDEAWAITSTPQGAKLIPEIARMGRSHNTALVLVSQNAGDLMAESVTNSISTKFAFRSTIPAEIDNVLELMALPHDQGHQQVIRGLRNGECVMQDLDGRVARVQVDAWDTNLFDAFNTNPETRGKASG